MLKGFLMFSKWSNRPLAEPWNDSTATLVLAANLFLPSCNVTGKSVLFANRGIAGFRQLAIQRPIGCRI
jgi:hypothetical protein